MYCLEVLNFDNSQIKTLIIKIIHFNLILGSLVSSSKGFIWREDKDDSCGFEKSQNTTNFVLATLKNYEAITLLHLFFTLQIN